jgi:hypothetical protein
VAVVAAAAAAAAAVVVGDLPESQVNSRGIWNNLQYPTTGRGWGSAVHMVANRHSIGSTVLSGEFTTRLHARCTS